jgi:hypothetical protein
LLREKRSRLGLPDLRIVARRVRDRNPFYLAFITNLSWHRIGWLLAAGCWLLAAGCWLLAAGCCDATTPFLLRALFTVLILTTKALSALWGVHLIGEVNRLMVNGRPVASEFLGFRRGSTSKKPDINPTNPT